MNYVIVVAGQSNAVGRCFNPLAYASIQLHTFTSKIWKRGVGWQTLNPLDHTQSFNQNVNQHGLEPYISYLFEKAFPDDRLFIIKHAEGATSLAQSTTWGTGRDWNENTVGELYDEFVEVCQSAFNSSELTTFMPLFFWWMQGESDATNIFMANNYEQNLTSFFSSLETDVPQLADFKKILGRIYNTNVWTYRNLIWRAQKQFCIKHDAILLNTDFATQSQDAGHYDSFSMHAIAKKLFAEVTSIGEVTESNGLVSLRGDWTAILGGTNGESGQEYYATGTMGRFERVGNIVACTFSARLKNAGAISGQALLKGLPFPVASMIKSRGGFSFGQAQNLGIPCVDITGFADYGQSHCYITIRTTASASSTFPNGSDLWKNETIVNGTIVYICQ